MTPGAPLKAAQPVMPPRLLKLLLLLLAIGTCALVPGQARAYGDAHIVWPEIGIGGGRMATPYLFSPALQVDFSMGFEVDRQPWAPGALFRLDILLAQDFYRYDFAPMLTYSIGYETATPYVRAGFGPLMSFGRYGYALAVGAGAHAELSVGFKSILDLYLDGRFGVDGLGPSFAVTSGIRLNALIFRFLSRGRRWYRL